LRYIIINIFKNNPLLVFEWIISYDLIYPYLLSEILWKFYLNQFL